MAELSGIKFVEEMRRLGYDCNHSEAFPEGVMSLLVEMAKKIQELETQHRANTD